MVFKAIERYGHGTPTVSELEGDELEEIKQKVLPFTPKSNKELIGLLGPKWFSFDCFTYVGPYTPFEASWSHLNTHTVDWLNEVVINEVLNRNKSRVLRVIPTPPMFDITSINEALWVLECEQTLKQGTGFHLKGVGVITCHHVVGSHTMAFKPSEPTIKYKVSVLNQNKTLDLAILKIDIDNPDVLSIGTADCLKQNDHIAIAGFPNYRIGDSGVFIPGLVTGFRPISSIRRILTNAPIVAGNSGGPVFDSGHRVIGVAVTGSDRMENAQETENHGIIPIDAIKFLI